MLRAVALFEDACGPVHLRSITKTTGAQFVRWLLDDARPFGSKTAQNHAVMITALLNAAAKVDLIDINPTNLAFDATAGAERRRPWDDQELETIFGQKRDVPTQTWSDHEHIQNSC